MKVMIINYRNCRGFFVPFLKTKGDFASKSAFLGHFV